MCKFNSFLKLLMLGSLFPITVFAEVVKEDLEVANAAPVPDGWMVAFKTQPIGCNGNYNGFHGFVSNTASEVVTDVLVARSAGVAIPIRYEVIGTCTDNASLVTLLGTE